MGKQYGADEIKEIVRLHEVEGMTHKAIAEKLGRMDRNGVPNGRAIMEQYSRFKRLQALGVPEKIVPMNTEERKVMEKEESVPYPPELLAEAREIDGPAKGTHIVNVPYIPPDLHNPTPPSGAGAGAGVPAGSQIVSKPDFMPMNQSAPEFQNVPNPSILDGPAKPYLSTFEEGVNIADLSRKQRFEYLERTLLASARAKHTFTKVLSPTEVELFKEEYFRVVREQDSLTNAEEQQLFTAILNFCLSQRALSDDQTARYNYANKVNGPTTLYDSRYHEQYLNHYKQYQDGLKSLKLSREQRLKDIAKSGTSFIDYAEIIAKRENQEGAAEEIIKIESMTEQEVRRLAENGWLIFGRSPINNPHVNYGSETVAPEEQEVNDTEE